MTNNIGRFSVDAIIHETSERLFNQNVMQNYARPHFVETLVDVALRPDWKFVGAGWTAWDFQSPVGLKLEVKQSASIQAWNSENEKVTKGIFGIEPKSTWFEANGSKQVFTKKPVRVADIYVFSWHGPESATRQGNKYLDQRDPSQWQFYVLPENALPTGQKTIALNRIQQIAAGFGQNIEGVSIQSLAKTVQMIGAILAPKSLEVFDNQSAPSL